MTVKIERMTKPEEPLTVVSGAVYRLPGIGEYLMVENDDHNRHALVVLNDGCTAGHFCHLSAYDSEVWFTKVQMENHLRRFKAVVLSDAKLVFTA
jgi:hypothetical protein